MEGSEPAKNELSPSTYVIIAFIFGAFLGGAASYIFLSMQFEAKSSISQDDQLELSAQQKFLAQGEVAKMLKEYINNNLVRKGDAVEVENAGEFSGIYKFKIKINSSAANQVLTADVYSTKDGELLILSLLNTSLPLPDEEGGEQESAAAEQKRGEQKRVIEDIADDDAVRGAPNASITIVEFSDFQCPFCARAYPTIKKVLETYAGKVKLVYRDFPLSSIHPFAQKAAEASECAEEQGKYWEYHDKLFEAQKEWAEKGTSQFKIYAEELKLDVSKFNACLESGKYAEEVSKDLSDGMKLGVTGTPTFFLNGKMIVGAQPFEVFQKAIEEELSKAR